LIKFGHSYLSASIGRSAAARAAGYSLKKSIVGQFLGEAVDNGTKGRLGDCSPRACRGVTPVGGASPGV
jgi:hypothetical protein